MEGIEKQISQEWEKVRFTRGQEVFVRNDKDILESGWEYLGDDGVDALVQRPVKNKYGIETSNMESRTITLRKLKEDFLEGYRHFEEIREKAEVFNDLMKENDPKPLPGSSGLLRWTDDGKVERIVLASVEDDPKNDKPSEKPPKFDDSNDTRTFDRPTKEQEEEYLRSVGLRKESEKAAFDDLKDPNPPEGLQDISESPTVKMPGIKMEQLSFKDQLLYAKNLDEFYAVCEKMDEKGDRINESGIVLTGHAIKITMRGVMKLLEEKQAVLASKLLRTRIPKGELMNIMKVLSGQKVLFDFIETEEVFNPKKKTSL
jgi:hypothetical protein